MTTYVRIHNGVVREIIVSDVAPITHPSIIWADATLVPDIGEGWLFDGTTFSAPPPIVIVPRLPSSALRTVIVDEDWINGLPHGKQSWDARTLKGAIDIDNSISDALHRGVVRGTIREQVGAYSSLSLWAAHAPLVGMPGLSFKTEIRTDGALQATVVGRVGFGNQVIPTVDHSNGFYFERNAAVSPYWILKCAANGAHAWLVSSVAVVNGAWIKLAARVVQDQSRVDFFINDVFAGSISSAIPLGAANTFFPIVSSYRHAASLTGDRHWWMDYFMVTQQDDE